MRKALFAIVVAGGIVPLSTVGCTSKSGPTLANNSSSDWFGAKKLAGLFKPDPAKKYATEGVSSHDPTSLAHKGKPPGADLYVASARLHEKQDNFTAAEDYYKRALQASPNDLAALLGYAHLLDRQSKFDEATTYYRQAVQHHPHDPAAHNDLGLCLARRGMLNESLVSLSKAVELAPDKKLYRNNIATVFVEMGQPQRALEHLMVAEQPAVAHYNLACLLHQRGQSQAAGFHFAQAAHHDPSMTAAQEWAEKLGAATAAPRMTSVRPVEQQTPYRPNTHWPQAAAAQVADAPAGAAPATPYRGMPGNGSAFDQASVTGGATGTAGWPQTGADRNWSAYDVSLPAGGPAARGSAYGAIPPTPENAGSYTLPASAAVDVLPPVEQSLPRY